MKKLTALFLSTLFLLSGSTGFAEVKPPEWSDFCPTQYVNAKYDSNDYSYKYNGFKELVLIFSVIGYPIAERHSHKYLASLEKVKEQNANNYWVSRRISFDKEVETCKSDPNNQSLCYLKVREMAENRQNQEDMKEIAQRQMLMQSLNNMNNSIQAQQTNNNLNSINNSINRIKY